METKYGVKGVMHEDVFFTEDNIPDAKHLDHFDVNISRQNANLSQVKDQLASKARQCGSKAVMNFKYGQKKHSPLAYLNPFKWDSESWFGKGDAVEVTQG